MALNPGTQLGPYEIVAPLGAGGMGEVYRAKDTRLDRSVAVKILPEHLAESPEAQQRFEREARAISCLNHPNICVLHDIGNQNGTSFLVMEMLEGETLEKRLQKGPLPLKQALEYGMQICDALERAHKAGIVHRDLKPGNIMLTPTGAKLLDFGLAKPVAGVIAKPASTSHSALTSAPTVNLTALTATPGPLTQQGAVVGTFQFMAPEVLQGQEADARSDIFSLGCVLYEMLTGKKAFEGKSQLSVMTAILENEPEPISKVQPLAPAALDHVVEGCLAKDPAARWQNAADVGRQLKWIGSSATSKVTPVSELLHKSRPERRVWASLVVLLLAGLVWLAMRPEVEVPHLKSFLPPPPGTGFDFTGDFGGPPAITSDGSMVVYGARGSKDRSALWVQSLNDLTPKKLEGSEGASFPFLSPDGKFVGFFADGHLKKMPTAGGPVTVLAEVTNARGGSWNRDNVIIYEPDYRNSIWKINASGGNAQQVTKLVVGRQTTHRWPVFLPDGEHFLFFATSHSTGDEQGVYYGSLKDGSFRRVVDSDSDGQYASGYLVYHVQTQLVAQKFDPGNGKVSGDPISIANGAEYDASTWHMTVALSQNGLMVYEPGSKMRGLQMLWMDRTGKQLGKVADEGAFKGSGRISPDGKKLAVSEGDPQNDIEVIDLESGNKTRLTFGGATHLMPTWTPDGKNVLYVKQTGATLIGGTSVCLRQANGGGQEKVLLGTGAVGEKTFIEPQVSGDGKYLLYMQMDGPTNGEIWAMPLTGDQKPFAVVKPANPQARLVQYSLSPNGKWLAYSSTDSGREQIYVTQFPSGEGRWQISQTSSTFPRWRADGKEIYFAGLEDDDLHGVEIQTNGDNLEVGQNKTLFPLTVVAPLGTPYDPAPDGKRFVIAAFPESASIPLVLVTNWTAGIKK